jgi:hypothetical protein
MQTYVLQPWTTLNLDPSVTAQRQDTDACLDLGPYSDGAFWIDVSNVVAGGGSPTLTIQTSPSLDDANFSPAAAPVALPLPSYSAPVVVRPMLIPLARYVRWQLASGGATSAWGATFRIRAVVSKQSTFLPSLLPGCVLWLRTDLGVTLTQRSGTSFVTAWADQSGQGWGVQQLVQSLQPSYYSGQQTGYLGQPIIQFDSGTHLASNFVWPTPMTVFIAGNLGNITLGYFCAGFNTGSFSIYDKNTFNNGVTVANASSTLVSTVTTGNTPSIVYVTASAPSWAIGVRQRTPQATGNLGSINTNNLWIGSDASGSNSLLGPIVEFAVYKSVLSPAQITMMTRYLAQRYGVSEGP